jgi:CheY-like chemotaxis protein
MDGFELLKSLHADPTISQTPVIALTGFASDDDREAVRRAGFNAYLTKPVEPQALLETLERVLAADTRPGAA